MLIGAAQPRMGVLGHLSRGSAVLSDPAGFHLCHSTATHAKSKCLFCCLGAKLMLLTFLCQALAAQILKDAGQIRWSLISKAPSSEQRWGRRE